MLSLCISNVPSRLSMFSPSPKNSHHHTLPVCHVNSFFTIWSGPDLTSSCVLLALPAPFCAWVTFQDSWFLPCMYLVACQYLHSLLILVVAWKVGQSASLSVCLSLHMTYFASSFRIQLTWLPPLLTFSAPEPCFFPPSPTFQKREGTTPSHCYTHHNEL